MENLPVILTFPTQNAMNYSYDMQYAWSSHLCGKPTLSNVLSDGTGLYLYGTSFHQVCMHGNRGSKTHPLLGVPLIVLNFRYDLVINRKRLS